MCLAVHHGNTYICNGDRNVFQSGIRWCDLRIEDPCPNFALWVFILDLAGMKALSKPSVGNHTTLTVGLSSAINNGKEVPMCL